jgi:hypothetical protein
LNEEEFIQSIDCCFPYSDEVKWKALVVAGAEISPNSAFMVLQEICRPPKSSKATPNHLKKIAEYWFEHFEHPLAARLYEIALHKINGHELSVSQVLAHFEEIRKFPNQYNALGIAYFACDDPEQEIEEPYNEIIRSWQSA